MFSSLFNPAPVTLEFPFNELTVTLLAPQVSGIYVLTTPSWRSTQLPSMSWTYVGRPVDLQARLLEHLHDSTSLISLCAPTHFGYEIWPEPWMALREVFLQYSLNPLCNLRHG